MNAPSVDIKDMLVAESSLGLVFDPKDSNRNLFVGREPSAKGAPDNCVTIFDTPGGSPQLTLAGTENYFYPSIQIKVRNKDYCTGWGLIHDIMVALHGRGQETWDETLYSVIQAAGGPAFMNWDENDRVSFVVNFDIQRR